MKTLHYHGYSATVEFDPEDMILTGRIAGIRDVVGFHADNAHDLVRAFHEAVDDYVHTCAKVGKKPEKPYSGKVMFRLHPAVHAKAALAAELSGKSLNAWGEDALRTAAERVVGADR